MRFNTVIDLTGDIPSFKTDFNIKKKEETKESEIIDLTGYSVYQKRKINDPKTKRKNINRKPNLNKKLIITGKIPIKRAKYK